LFASKQVGQKFDVQQIAPGGPVVRAIAAHVVIVRDLVLLEDLVEDDAAVGGLVFASSQTDEE